MTNAWQETLGVFDLETTGVDIETSRIVSAHVGIIDSTGASIESQQWLADPGVEIPLQASAVHGITTDRARAEGRRSIDVVSEIILAIRSIFDRGHALAIYNAPYDLSLLNREARRHGLVPLVEPGPIIDPLVIDKALDRYRQGKRTLEAAAAVYRVELTDAHNAGADAIAAGRLAQALVRRYPDELSASAGEIHRRQVDWCAEQAARFQEFMRAKNPGFTANGRWPER